MSKMNGAANAYGENGGQPPLPRRSSSGTVINHLTQPSNYQRIQEGQAVPVQYGGNAGMSSSEDRGYAGYNAQRVYSREQLAEVPPLAQAAGGPWRDSAYGTSYAAPSSGMAHRNDSTQFDQFSGGNQSGRQPSIASPPTSAARYASANQPAANSPYPITNQYAHNSAGTSQGFPMARPTGSEHSPLPGATSPISPAQWHSALDGEAMRYGGGWTMPTPAPVHASGFENRTGQEGGVWRGGEHESGSGQAIAGNPRLY